jgi:hypothetical protein
MVKGKITKGKTTIYKTLHRKLKNEQHESHWNPGVNLGAPETTIYELMAIESFWQFGAIGSLRKRSEILSRILSTHEGVINAQ